ncbi:hypothetical protein MA16_Dca006842 [Dendrobium catenatum]|uniref:Uncharacterized protein n=1 Tax=Dendrobium catenatum TaxID=906689 RepID=A0A2I0VSY3_9ASPA|nr:hypothetical protein MA16_Dca006842 [Dendrobium catenatum]
MVEAADVVEKSYVAPGKSSDNVEAVRVEVLDVHSNNRFAILIEKYEEVGLEKHREIDKALDRGLYIPETDASHIGLGSHSGASNIKLAKELRSLGPVELDYKKKKRDGRLKSSSGERSSIPGFKNYLVNGLIDGTYADNTNGSHDPSGVVRNVGEVSIDHLASPISVWKSGTGWGRPGRTKEMFGEVFGEFLGDGVPLEERD